MLTPIHKLGGQSIWGLSSASRSPRLVRFHVDSVHSIPDP